ncbi:RNase H domain-containing protein [Trichonephila clavipes]|nr:RNase H domain-containing protein [Trichonephila clavipes]
MKRVIMHHIFKVWQESWSQQLDNKLHSVKPIIVSWPVMPMRRTDVKLTPNFAACALGKTHIHSCTHTPVPPLRRHLGSGFVECVNRGNKGEYGGSKVCDVRRITIRRDGQVLNTKHLILTFSTPELPQFVKAPYLHCPVRPYIPNPLRCFQCQRFGHSKTVCRGQPTCSRCAEVGHDSADCKAKERCVNCKGDHSSFSRSCPTWILEKEITAVKIKINFLIRRLGVLYHYARQFLEKAMHRRNKTYQTIAIQVDASTAPKSAQSESVQPKSLQ